VLEDTDTLEQRETCLESRSSSSRSLARHPSAHEQTCTATSMPITMAIATTRTESLFAWRPRPNDEVRIATTTHSITQSLNQWMMDSCSDPRSNRGMGEREATAPVGRRRVSTCRRRGARAPDAVRGPCAGTDARGHGQDPAREEEAGAARQIRGACTVERLSVYSRYLAVVDIDNDR